MRAPFICSVLIVLALVGFAPSAAQSGSSAPQRAGPKVYHYSMCTCHFGYGHSCLPAVSCAGTGGQCGGSCVAPAKPE